MTLMRRLLFVLLTSNLLLLLWNVVRPTDLVTSQSREEGDLNALAHISELPASQIAGVALASDSPGMERACLVRGPFDADEDAHAVMQGSGIPYEIGVQRLADPAAPLYRAMIAPSGSISEAQSRLADVRAAIDRIGGGIDTYLVTTGPIANAVSLGLFSEQSNALNVQSALAGQGIDVVIEMESRVQISYWIVVDRSEVVDIVDESEALEVFRRVPPELSENLCEMIAQAE